MSSLDQALWVLLLGSLLGLELIGKVPPRPDARHVQP